MFKIEPKYIELTIIKLKNKCFNQQMSGIFRKNDQISEFQIVQNFGL